MKAFRSKSCQYQSLALSNTILKSLICALALKNEFLLNISNVAIRPFAFDLNLSIEIIGKELDSRLLISNHRILRFLNFAISLVLSSHVFSLPIVGASRRTFGERLTPPQITGKQQRLSSDT